MNASLTAAPKKAFVILGKDGATLLAANIPQQLRVGTALPELAQYAGYTAEPDVSTRYALLCAGPEGEGHGDLTLLRDDVCFADLDEGSLLRIAPQPRPATV